MPLPPALDGKICNRFDELITEGSELVANLDEYSAEHYSDHEELTVKSCGLIQHILGDSDASREYQQLFKKRESLGGVAGQPRWYQTAQPIHRTVAILKGLKDNYVNGFYDDLEERIVADISADYMGQAEALLGEGIPGQYDYVPAAVLCGAVLEDAIRRLCDRQSPPIPTIKSNGDFKKMTGMIDELKGANVYNAMKRDQLQSWAKIRNSAAHGRFTEFTRKDVESMLDGVKNFLADNL